MTVKKPVCCAAPHVRPSTKLDKEKTNKQRSVFRLCVRACVYLCVRACVYLCICVCVYMRAYACVLCACSVCARALPGVHSFHSRHGKQLQQAHRNPHRTVLFSLTLLLEGTRLRLCFCTVCRLNIQDHRIHGMRRGQTNKHTNKQRSVLDSACL